MTRNTKHALIGLIALAITFAATVVHAQDPLPSWNDGPAKKAINDFVTRVTIEGGPDFVRPAHRVATFDNDGTLWVEQPMYTQVEFALQRVPVVAKEDPKLGDNEIVKAILSRDREAMEKFTLQDIEKIVAMTHSGMTVEQFQQIVKDWIDKAEHPKLKRPYTKCIYQPMLEVMEYLRANGFRTYIVTGGGQDFVRAFAEKTYGVPRYQVIGSAGKVKYEYKDGKAVLIKIPEVLLIDDKAGKPEGINFVIGQRPIAAFGNSTGDQQMLEYTGSASGARLMMLVHHDDADREFAYGADSKIGTFSNALMDEAKSKGWGVISMKNDWKTIFPGGESGKSE